MVGNYDSVLIHLAPFQAVIALTSLAIYPKVHLSSSTVNALSTVLAQPSIRDFEIRRCSADKNRISWPLECTVQRLTIHDCSRRQVSETLAHCPRLRTLVLGIDFWKDMPETFSIDFVFRYHVTGV